MPRTKKKVDDDVQMALTQTAPAEHVEYAINETPDAVVENVIASASIPDAIPAATEGVRTYTPQVQKVMYQNVGDQMMTIYHLYPNRTPIPYSNGKKKVFNKFGEKWSMSVREFEQEFSPSPIPDILLKQKVIAVGSDCPDEVRERLDIDYTNGKMITPETYKIMLNLGTEEICELFTALCIEHKQLMVKIFADDFELNKGLHCQRDKIKALNDISKKFVRAGETGMFAGLLKEITNAEEQNY